MPQTLVNRLQRRAVVFDRSETELVSLQHFDLCQTETNYDGLSLDAEIYPCGHTSSAVLNGSFCTFPTARAVTLSIW